MARSVSFDPYRAWRISGAPRHLADLWPACGFASDRASERTLDPVQTAFVLALVMVQMLGVSGLPGHGAPAGGIAEGQTAVMTADGPVIGTAEDGYRLFQGVPYAAPPTGEHRWKAPQPVTPWAEPHDATLPGHACPQISDPATGEISGDEDCLLLNVTTPDSATSAAPRPVMVWLHGAGGGQGSASGFDARRLATDGDVVVVAANYRLGVLGNFGYPGLAGSGSFGLQDQQAALRWVQRNIAAFGGDPNNVTLFGESSGGMNVCGHLTSPTAAGLFQRAIVQSGSCLMHLPANSMFPDTPAASIWATTDEVAAIGSQLAADLGCAGDAAMTCLREAPVADLMSHPYATAAFGRVAFGNAVLPENPAQALRDGRFHRVPVMIGATRDEADYFVATVFQEPITAERYVQFVREAFLDTAEAVLDRYPSAAYPAPALAWAAVVTDAAWVCPTLEAGRLLSQHVPTFVYEFADDTAPLIFPAPGFPVGAYHAADVVYLFDVPVLNVTLNPEQQRLSETMIGYWSRFAHFGDPNGTGLPAWRPFDADHPMAQGLATGARGVHPVDADAAHHCAFWAEIAPGQIPDAAGWEK